MFTTDYGVSRVITSPYIPGLISIQTLITHENIKLQFCPVPDKFNSCQVSNQLQPIRRERHPKNTFLSDPFPLPQT